MIDSHCHLDHEPLFSDLSNIIHRSKNIGIEKLLTISTTLESFTKIKEIITRDEMIYGTIGIHPHEANKDQIDAEFIINNFNAHPKIIGIGETGLDFYYNHSDKDKQISSFIEHIEASIKTDSPLIIHSRAAENETFNILNDFKSSNLKILMHCFTGSKNLADKLMNLNAYFSASGIITFKNSIELQKTFSHLPLDKILIETDSPYLAPVPNRGKKNEPSFIDFTAAKMAEIKKISKEELIKTTTNNFNKLFFN
ncbi:TatD family hydrolase [Pelagibacterales bacterium SAG-MED13]|nr:TatD family hydrolase [Pelagibacterales bacterium SAG-MED13]